jgi:hypothetical protein
MLTRRTLLLTGTTALAAAATAPARAAGSAKGFEITLTDAEWRKRLTPAQFAVLRKEDTERAGSSPLNAEKRTGTYHCAGCDLPVYRSETKFESGTGWPSFYRAHRGRGGDAGGPQARLPHPHGGPLPPLRRASGPRLRRRAEAHGDAPLPQRRGAHLQAGGGLTRQRRRPCPAR